MSLARITAVAVALVALTASPALAGSTSSEAQRVVQVVREVMREQHLEAVIVRVDRGRDTVVTRALGESMTGVPATPDMRFRIGSMSIPYLTTIALQLEEAGRLDLDDPVSKYLPDTDYPNADRVTLRMLGHATSGYPDWIQGNQAFVDLLLANPFRLWTEDELLRHAFAQPLICEPGTCFHYAHTNFVILGQVVEAVTGKPFARLVRRRIFRPLGLRNTTITRTAEIPSPTLHAYGTDRGIYEDTSSWSPSWGLGNGQLMTADVGDVVRSARGVLSGRLVSRRSERAFVERYGDVAQPPNLHYGLGVIVVGEWRIQNPYVNDYGGVMAYLPRERLSIAIVSTKGRDAEAEGNGSETILSRLAAELTPRQPVTWP